MERIRSLIDKINIQFAEKAPLNQLLTTVQMLQAEITGSIREVDVLGTSSISVIVPNVKPMPGKPIIKEANEEKEYFELVMDDITDDDVVETSNDIPSYEELIKLQSEIKGQVHQHRNLNDNYFDEMPTLARQVNGSRLAEQVNLPKADKNAIEDLYKAINAQDRLVFIRELFRGDEVVFERSIKTIENFNSFVEAKYWIQRELSTKNGWLTDNPIVKQFEQLVKRRFS